MKTKKHPGADLQNKKGMFFFLALTVSLSLVLTAFEWRTFEKVVLTDGHDIVCGLPEPPIALIPPPPEKHIIVTPTIYDTPETEINHQELQAYFSEDSAANSDTDMIKIQEYVPDNKDIEIEYSNEIGLTSDGGETIFCSFPEKSPEFPNGLKAMYQYLSKNLRYPKSTMTEGISGRVFVQFLVDEDGAINQVEVIKGIDSECDLEAARVVKSMPKWIPGTQSGMPVKVRMIIPVYFKLKN